MKYKSYNTVCFKVFLFISVIFGCLCFNNVVQAEEEEYSYGDYKYSIDSSGNVTITDYISNEKDKKIIIIPDQIEGKTVTSIGDCAFWNRSFLTSIKIPSSVTSIGGYAFKYCSGLTSIDIPSGVTVIGDSTFEECSGLISIKIPTSVTSIGNHAFSGCTKLTSIEIPSNVTSIGNAAFWKCKGLTSIEIPSNVTTIESAAFSGCSGLTSIEIPSNVTTIESAAFSGCRGLTSIEIPSSVTEIEYEAFSGCRGLTSIEIPSSVTAIGSSAFSGCSGLTSIEIPSSVTAIGFSAFLGCSGLTSIELPSGITSIGGSAFEGCSGLTSIDIPSGVTVIDDSTFEGCSGLTSIEIPSSVTRIRINAFYDCSGLTSIKIPSSVKSIGNHAFSGCTKLTSIEIPSNVKSIGNAAFAGCTGLTSIDIPFGVTSIGEYAFEKCSGLTSIEIPSGVTYISTSAFSGCSGLTSIKIPTGVTTIGDGAFEKCSGLTSIEIPSSVTKIGTDAFQDCKGLTSIEIPTGVTTIGGSAFRDCSGLTSIEIPSSVTAIGSSAFSGCGLKDVYYLGDQNEWESISGKNYVPSSVTIHFNTPNTNTPKYKSSNYADDGGIWKDYTYWNIKTNQETNDVKLSIFGRGDMPSEFELWYDPDTQDIGVEDTFPWKDYRENVTTLYIDNDITLISRNTFADMHNLSVVEIPLTVTHIEPDAFYGDNSIREIHFQGTLDEWNSIYIKEGNEALESATVICKYDAGWREAQGPKLYEEIDYSRNKIRIDGKEYYFAGCMLNDSTVAQKVARYIYYKVDDDGIVYAMYKRNYKRPSKKKNVTIPDDVWRKSNYSLRDGIPGEYYSDLFYKDVGLSIQSIFNWVGDCNGKEGICHGLIFSVLLFSRGILDVNDLYYVDTVNSSVLLCDKLSDACVEDNPDTVSIYKIAGLSKNGENLTVKDLWYYAYIYQKEANYIKQYNSNTVGRYIINKGSNRYNDILTEIKYEIDKYGSCYLGVKRYLDWGKTMCHSLLAVGYDDSDPEKLLLQIYDCNVGSNNRSDVYIEFYIDDGSVYNWKYVYGPGTKDELVLNADNADISYTTNDIALAFLPWLAKAGITYDANVVPPKPDTGTKLLAISGGKTNIKVAGTVINMENVFGSSNGSIIPIYEDEDGNIYAWFEGDDISVEARDGVEFSIVTDSYELVNQLPAGSSMTYTATLTTEEQTGYTVSIVNPTNEEVVVTFNGQDNTTSTITVPANEELQCTGNGESIEEVKPDPKYFSEWVNGKWYDKDGSQTYPYTLSWKSNKKGKWVVDTKGWYPKNQWQKIDGVTYFFKADGYMASGEWCKNYWINTDGSCSNTKATWKKDKNGYWFGNSGWYAKNQWQMIDGKWYYFKADGYMASNEWCKGYWLNKDGSYTYAGKASWKKDKIGWYYSDNKGWYAKKQWQKIDGKWYYFDAKGYITTGTKTIGGKTYRFNSSGVCLNP